MRHSVTLPAVLELEGGGQLAEVEIAFETWGEPNPDRAILVLHALTGDSNATNWWPGLIGPGKPLDTNEYHVVVPNVLGGCQGTTGPSSTAPDGRAYGSRFPSITVRDQVAAEAALADLLGITRWSAVLGGSMGGMRALEWAVTFPDRVARLLLLACPSAASADQIGWTIPQLHAIRTDPSWLGGDYHEQGVTPGTGLGIARRIAHLTYRTEAELDTRFGRKPQSDDRFAIESYLDHHADKLVNRFDAASYVTLTEAMNSHDIARDRGGVREALARITAKTLVAGIDTDRLYPLYQQEQLADGIATADRVRIIRSPYGHDAFLIETEQLAQLIKELLAT